MSLPSPNPNANADELEGDVELYYRLVEPYAFRLLREGQKRISMDAIFEMLRADAKVPLTNSLKPQVARLLRERNPELRALITVKPLGRKKRVFTVADLRKAMDIGHKQGFKQGFSAGYAAGVKVGS